MTEKQPSVAVRFYIDVVLAVGLWVWICAGLQHSFRHGTLFLGCLVMAFYAATLKIRLPGIEGTFSLGFVGALVAVQELDFSEAIVVGTLVAVTQCLWKPARWPAPDQVAFNAANLANSTAVAYAVYRGLLSASPNNCSLVLLVAAAAFYLVNTGTVSGVLCLLEGKPLAQMMEHWCIWSFSYFLAGALLAVLVQSIAGLPLVPLVLLAPLFLAHVIYRGYIDSLEASGECSRRVASKPV